ncbi:hypothetical protein LTR05_006974 [Lithohypha guttulata]|uniref:Uncharacterized protein n=1 Tax=Lithohypha guttulata TaxID=1690604 RepID=A0AAN7Y4V3_9EURO|nr:hypothetical protein LTR05_006974 [Lithohypha guttulata]
MIKITSFLENARELVSSMRRSVEASNYPILASLSQIQQDLFKYWQTLPQTTYCRDLSTSGVLFRPNLHLALTYHLVHVFVGRYLIFDAPRISMNVDARLDAAHASIRTELTENCFESALAIFGLCEKLQETTGLARASYTEFTTCWAALLVVLAKRTCESDTRLRTASAQGIRLLKHMSLGLYAATAEKAATEAMQTVFERLETRTQARHMRDFESDGSAYENFKNWALLWNIDTSGGSNRSEIVSGGLLSPMRNADQDFCSPMLFIDELDFTTGV